MTRTLLSFLLTACFNPPESILDAAPPEYLAAVCPPHLARVLRDDGRSLYCCDPKVAMDCPGYDGGVAAPTPSRDPPCFGPENETFYCNEDDPARGVTSNGSLCRRPPDCGGSIVTIVACVSTGPCSGGLTIPAPLLPCHGPVEEIRMCSFGEEIVCHVEPDCEGGRHGWDTCVSIGEGICGTEPWRVTPAAAKAWADALRDGGTTP